MPLLRKVVAIPNNTPDVKRYKSWVAVDCPPRQRLLTNNKHPAKVRAAQELSAYGEERNKPAGEIIWSRAAVKAKPGAALGNMAKESSKMRKTELKWAM